MEIDESLYIKIWETLNKKYHVYENMDITYFEFTNICNELKINPDKIDVDMFNTKYKVNVG